MLIIAEAWQHADHRQGSRIVLIVAKASQRADLHEDSYVVLIIAKVSQRTGFVKISFQDHAGSKRDPHLFAVTKGAQELHQHAAPEEAPRPLAATPAQPQQNSPDQLQPLQLPLDPQPSSFPERGECSSEDNTSE